MRNRVVSRTLLMMSAGILVLSAIAPVSALTFDPSICAGYDPAEGEPSTDCIAMMEAFPEPTLIDIPKDLRTLRT